MNTRRLPLILSGLLGTPLLAAWFGGWAVITVQSLPDHVVAGQPVRLDFTIRQHGVSLLADLKPTIEFSPGGAGQVNATPGASKGQYGATFVVPQAGQARISINSGFGNSRVVLLPVTVIAAGATAPAPPAEAERGRALFVAKGCFNCHTHRDVEAQAVGPIGPELTDRHLSAEYLRQKIGNPASAGGTMPNLELEPAEIAAVIAFLNAERR